MANGVYVGSLERDGDLAVVFNDAADQVGRANDGKKVDLDILVMQIGRSNFGNTYDLKGLVSGLVLLNSTCSSLTHSLLLASRPLQMDADGDCPPCLYRCKLTLSCNVKCIWQRRTFCSASSLSAVHVCVGILCTGRKSSGQAPQAAASVTLHSVVLLVVVRAGLS